MKPLRFKKLNDRKNVTNKNIKIKIKLYINKKIYTCFELQFKYKTQKNYNKTEVQKISL